MRSGEIYPGMKCFLFSSLSFLLAVGISGGRCMGLDGYKAARD